MVLNEWKPEGFIFDSCSWGTVVFRAVQLATERKIDPLPLLRKWEWGRLSPSNRQNKQGGSFEWILWWFPVRHRIFCPRNHFRLPVEFCAEYCRLAVFIWRDRTQGAFLGFLSPFYAPPFYAPGIQRHSSVHNGCILAPGYFYRDYSLFFFLHYVSQHGSAATMVLASS